MNIDRLAGKLALRADMTKGGAKTVIQIVFEEVAKAAATGDTIHIADFGKFTVKDRPERLGRNPRTGEAVTIAASKKVSFKAARGLKNRL